MKNKEPKKKWTGKKQIWYGAAGLFCLVAAVLVVGAGILTGQHKHDSSQLVFRRDTGSLKKQRQTLGWTPTWASSPRSAARRGEEERAGAGRP